MSELLPNPSRGQLLLCEPFFRAHIHFPSGIIKRDMVVSIRQLNAFNVRAKADFEKLELTYHDWSLINTIRSTQQHVSLYAELAFYVPDRWKCDLYSNIQIILGIALDWLKFDDRSITKLSVEKHAAKENTHCEIRIGCVAAVEVDNHGAGYTRTKRSTGK